jgi:predicted enzyme related to lactoylglutathione lyase
LPFPKCERGAAAQPHDVSSSGREDREMAEVKGFTHGTPCWVDVGASDIGAAGAFYRGMFGWETHDQGEGAGHYTMCELRGQSVAAIAPSQGGSPSWTTYFAVDDVDVAMRRIAAARGTVLDGPIDVFEAGRMAVAQDPTGGFFCIWQAREHVGSTLVNEPGALCWNELIVRDAPRALSFYGAVFDMTVKTSEFDGHPYHELQVDGRTVAGVVPMNEQLPPGAPTHWKTYFAVDDCDTAAARAEGLGATVSMPPTDLRPGRCSVLSDPQGAAFSIVTMPGE